MAKNKNQDLSNLYKIAEENAQEMTQVIQSGTTQVVDDYNPTLYPYKAMLCVANGMTIKQIAKSFGVTTKVLNSWRKIYPEFNDAIAIGADKMALEVTSSLYNLAVGNCQEITTQTVFDKETGEERKMETVKQLAPNIKAIEKILATAKPEVWKDSRNDTVKDMVSSLSTFYDIEIVKKAKRLKNKEAELIKDSRKHLDEEIEDGRIDFKN